MRLALLALLLVGLAAPAPGQIDDRLSLGGAAESYTGLRLDAEPDLLAARTRADLRLAFDYERGRVVLRPRLDVDGDDVPDFRIVQHRPDGSDAFLTCVISTDDPDDAISKAVLDYLDEKKKDQKTGGLGGRTL